MDRLNVAGDRHVKHTERCRLPRSRCWWARNVARTARATKNRLIQLVKVDALAHSVCVVVYVGACPA